MPISGDIEYRVDPPMSVAMRTLPGGEVSVTTSVVDLAPERIELTGAVPFQDWMTVLDHGGFHVDLELGELDDDPARDVQLVLVLRAPFAYEYDDADAFMLELFGDDDSVLHRTEAWMLAEATQAVDVPDADGAVASSGFRTSWARPLG